jgi:hypothetical protein
MYVPHTGYKSDKKENIRTTYVTGKLFVSPISLGVDMIKGD